MPQVSPYVTVFHFPRSRFCTVFNPEFSVKSSFFPADTINVGVSSIVLLFLSSELYFTNFTLAQKKFFPKLRPIRWPTFNSKVESATIANQLPGQLHLISRLVWASRAALRCSCSSLTTYITLQHWYIHTTEEARASLSLLPHVCNLRIENRNEEGSVKAKAARWIYSHPVSVAIGMLSNRWSLLFPEHFKTKRPEQCNAEERRTGTQIHRCSSFRKPGMSFCWFLEQCNCVLNVHAWRPSCALLHF